MSNYTFTFKKDDIFVEFATTDKDIVERQLQIWVAAADRYVRKDKQTQRVQPQKTINQAIQNQNPGGVGSDAPVETVSQPAAVEPSPVVSKEEDVVKKEAVDADNGEVLDKASTLLKTINSIQQESQGESAPEQPNSQVPQNDFESVLEQKIENPTFEPEVTKDPVFLNLVKSKNTTDKFHYLIITAYYLSEFEKVDRFSIKLINSKLMQNLSEVVDHTTLQDAINQQFIEVIPDLTGVSDIAEYRLTRLGEEFFANKI